MSLESASPDGAFPNSATPPASSAYYSVRFSRPDYRDALARLIAWHGQIRDVLDTCHDQHVACLKLQWWRDELQRAASGKAQHPLAQSLTSSMQRAQLPLQSFHAITEATELDVRQRKAQNLGELRQRMEMDLGGLFELIGRCHGIEDDERLAACRTLGGFCSQVYLMRDLGAHLRRNFNPLPADLPDSMTTGREHDYTKALGTLARHARESYDKGRAFGLCPPTLTVRAAILHALLNELEGSAFAVANQRICLTPLHKLWIGWRASRKADPALR